ncbi:hypothetical protein [Clostridium rectalis]|uniref:hypothetical protein n=1 Tax=Clostridium rectalis TaxID=2040295 RepID=UPI0013DE4D6F|nr:hypothetical protein [Clostridium rectalis]
MLDIKKTKDKAIPRVRITAQEEIEILKRIKELGINNISNYVRYCINKDLRESEKTR